MAEKNVLLVDDEDYVVNALARLLRKEPYNVLKSTDPLKACELLKSRKIDLVVCDNHMPRMTGLDVLKLAKDYNDAVICILLSGKFSTQEAAVAANIDSVDQLLTKPWSGEKLKDLIHSMLEKHTTETKSQDITHINRDEYGNIIIDVNY